MSSKIVVFWESPTLREKGTGVFFLHLEEKGTVIVILESRATFSRKDAKDAKDFKP